MHRTKVRRVVVSLGLGLLAGCAAHGGSMMTHPPSEQSAIFSPSTTAAVVRYQVQDVDRSVAFYTQHLGFHLTQRSGPVAIVSRGDLHLLFSGPASSGSRPMPDGRLQKPGGWNRIVLYVDRRERASGTRSRSGRVASRSWSRIPMPIPSSFTRNESIKEGLRNVPKPL